MTITGSHDPLLDVRGLSVDFQVDRHRAVRVVSDVSFAVGNGEVLGLVGESGSGKTVSCLGMLGLLPSTGRVTGGKAMFLGQDLLALRRRQLRALRGRHVSMIFQDAFRCLNPAFTVGDQIAEAIRAHEAVPRHVAMDRARELLELVEIPDATRRLHDYPHRFSGGMCQRAMLAIALACRPRLLFADEPTTALDVTVQSQVLALLKSLQAELGLSIVFITHDLGVVAELCDRVAVMYAGQVVEIGGLTQTFFEPRHPYTSSLLASIPSIDGDEADFGFIPGTVPTPGCWPSGCHFAERCGHRRDECTAHPVELQHTHGGPGMVRCVRASELSLAGVER